MITLYNLSLLKNNLLLEIFTKNNNNKMKQSNNQIILSYPAVDFCLLNTEIGKILLLLPLLF